jgi:hypothetical protein
MMQIGKQWSEGTYVRTEDIGERAGTLMNLAGTRRMVSLLLLVVELAAD